MKHILPTLAVLATALTIAQAGLKLGDDFASYPDGEIVANSSGAWFDNSSSASTTPMLVSNQSLIVSYARSQDIAHLLADGPYVTNAASAAVLYSSFKLKCVALPSGYGAYFASFSGTNAFYDPTKFQFLAGHRARVWSSVTNYQQTWAGTNKFWLGIVNSGPSADKTNAVNGLWTTALTTNVTYRIVTKYVVATGQSTIWVDPVAESSTHATADDALPADNQDGIIKMSHYSFRQASGEGTMLINDLQVATNWADLFSTPYLTPAPADQSIPMNGSTPTLAFQVGSPITNASSLSVLADSDNPDLVPADSSHIILTVVPGTGGTNRTVQVVPGNGKQGIATIKLTVTDNIFSNSVSFKISVGTTAIGTIPTQVAIVNTPIPTIPFYARDAEGDGLSWSASSSNPNLLPAGNVSVGGSGTNRTVTLTPQPGVSGVAYVTIYVSDGFTTNSTTFALIMRPLLGLLFSDNFSYSDFSASGGIPALYLASPGPQIGAAWNHISPPPSNYFQIQVTNGWVYMGGTSNSQDVGASLSITNYGSNGVVFYTGFQLVCSYLPTTGGGYFLHLKPHGDDSANFRCKIFVNRANAAPGSFRLGIANSANTGVQLARDLGTNVIYKVVVRYNSVTGESLLWVDPHDEQSAGALATDSPGSSTIGGIALRNPWSNSDGTAHLIGDLAIAALKVGTAFTDVADPYLKVQRAGSDVVLSWLFGQPYQLQVANDLAGPYTTLPAATSPYTNAISAEVGTVQFFRLFNIAAQ